MRSLQHRLQRGEEGRGWGFTTDAAQTKSGGGRGSANIVFFLERGREREREIGRERERKKSQKERDGSTQPSIQQERPTSH